MSKINKDKLIEMLKHPDTIISIIGKYDGEDEAFEIDREWFVNNVVLPTEKQK